MNVIGEERAGQFVTATPGGGHVVAGKTKNLWKADFLEIHSRNSQR
jgi:hypothetical protein